MCAWKKSTVKHEEKLKMMVQDGKRKEEDEKKLNRELKFGEKFGKGLQQDSNQRQTRCSF